MVANTTRSISDQIQMLRAATPATSRVLSAYLETSRRRADNTAYLLAFRDAYKTIRAELEPGERDHFERAVKQAERYLSATGNSGQPGLALFASGADDYFFALPLPRQPAEEVAWGERPMLGPLEEILNDCERIAVVLFDKERARIFSVYMGEIEETRTFQDEVPGKQATGGWFGLSQSRYARHHEDHVLRHARHAIDELAGLLQERPFDRLLIGGPDEALTVLRRSLPRPMLARLAGTINAELFASDATVLQAAMQVAAVIEQREEQAAIGELLDRATSTHTVLGLRPTLEALYEGRVHRLFIADSFGGEGGECPSCGRVIPGPAHCSVCGLPTRALGDLRERIMELARATGASVKLVAGQAAALLMTHDGIGAWTRH